MCNFAAEYNKSSVMENIKYIENRIWQAGDWLNRFLSRYESAQLILSFVFLRRIDCLIGVYAAQSMDFYRTYKDQYSDEKMSSSLMSLSGGYPFYNVSGLNFDNILLTDRSFDVAVESYFQGFSYNVQDILEGMQFRSNMATLWRNSKNNEIIFRFFHDIDLSECSVDNEMLLDLIFFLIGKMGTVSYYESATPEPLSNLMAELLFQQSPKSNSISIYDPVCGTGGLLAQSFIKAQHKYNSTKGISLFGQDVNYRSVNIAKVVALLINNDSNNILHGDTLVEDKFHDRAFDFILADMPIKMPWKHLKFEIEHESITPGGRFSIGLPGLYDSQFLFIEHMVSKMSPSGSRAVFITSEAVLNGNVNNSGENRIRRWLFENDLVECVISLPNRVLYPASKVAPIYLWVLSNNKSDERKGKTQLINGIDEFISEKGYKKMNLDQIAQIIHYYKSYKDSNSSRILPNDQLGFYEIAYSEEKSKKRKSVVIGLNTDVDSYFNKNVIPFAKGRVDIDYTSVEKGYAVDFSNYFKKEESTVALEDFSSRSIKPLLNVISSFGSDIKTIGNLEIKTKEDIKENTSQWIECPLNYLVTIINGTAKPKKQDKNGLPLLSISFLRNPNIEVDNYEWNESDDKTVSDNDVLLASKGSNVGEVFRGVKGIAYNTLTILRPQNSVILPKYLYYLLKGYENTLRGYSKGAGILSLDTKALGVMKLLLPPLDTQKSIVAFLDSIDEKVEAVNNMIGAKNNVFSDYRNAVIEAAVRGKLKIS